MSRDAGPGRGRQGGDRPSKRAEAKAARRRAISEAALAVFLEDGFAAARMDEIAARAMVAKGTLYLHFADKEALFEEIVRSTLVGPIEQLAADAPHPDETARGFLERRFLPLLLSLEGSVRGDVIRLLIAEGSRFPRLAETYHREVIGRGIGLLRRLGAHARATGEAGADILERHPQLVVAPALVGLVWAALFGRLQPIDMRALLEAQFDLVFGPQPSETKCI